MASGLGGEDMCGGMASCGKVSIFVIQKNKKCFLVSGLGGEDMFGGMASCGKVSVFFVKKKINVF